MPLLERNPSPLCPRGPWLRSEFCCLGPSSLTAAPSASLAGTRRLHGTALIRHAFAVREHLGDPRDFPDFHCYDLPHVPPTLTPVGPLSLPRCHRIAVSGFLALGPSRHPQYPASASYTRRGADFGAALFASCYGPRVCQAPLTGYDEMKPYALHPAFSGPCHSRFWRHPSPGVAGSQARKANGKPPFVGTLTRQVTAASTAAP